MKHSKERMLFYFVCNNVQLSFSIDWEIFFCRMFLEYFKRGVTRGNYQQKIRHEGWAMMDSGPNKGHAAITWATQFISGPAVKSSTCS